MPLVSVVMPVRNAERYIGEAVRSILSQTFRDLELVVVDDGSTDGSIAKVERIADERITIMRGPSRGVSAARNAGIAAGDSKFVAFMDADDVSDPNRIARQLDVLNGSRPYRYLAVGCSYRAIDQYGNAILVAPHLTNHRAVAAAAYSFNPVCGSSLVVLRDRIEAAGAFPDNDLGEDYELVCRLLRLGDSITNIPEPLYAYRWHDNTSRRRRDDLDAALAVVRERHWQQAPPAPTLRESYRATGRPRRLHASATMQLAIRLARQRRPVSAMKVTAGTVAGNPWGVVALALTKRRAGRPRKARGWK